MSEEQAFEQSGQSESNTEIQQIEQSGGGDANGTTENEDDRFLQRIFLILCGSHFDAAKLLNFDKI